MAISIKESILRIESASINSENWFINTLKKLSHNERLEAGVPRFIRSRLEFQLS